MSARYLLSFAVILLAGLLVGGQAAAVECSAVGPWINEIDYDDDHNALFNLDRDEFVEIAAPAGTDLTGYRVIIVEGTGGGCFSGFGSAGNAYVDQALSGPAAIVGDEGGGIGYVSVCLTSTSTHVSQCDITIAGAASDSNLKNGSLTAPAGNCADGVLILDPQGNLVDAVGWEGQVANSGAFGQYFQPATTPYFLFPPIYDDGWGEAESVYRNDSDPARASAQSQWSVSSNNGSTPSAANPGQGLSCTTEICGDGVLEGSEECDDGNTTSEDGCSATCVVEFCGDGVAQAGLGEECDDANNVSEDGCSDVCVAETCGDAVLQAGLGEECDDGGNVSEDGCSDVCVAESCGDGVIQAGLGEACDDGNNVSEDGCSDVCVAESCGDGVLQAGLGEACDDGNLVNLDGCDASCAIEIGVCGNGLVEFGEACDDGNQISGDGCSSACANEPNGVCGDNVIHPNEVCEDGNLINGDGCSSICESELVGVCGDAVVHPLEECDDGNSEMFDGCSNGCLVTTMVPATSPTGSIVLMLTIAAMGMLMIVGLRRTAD